MGKQIKIIQLSETEQEHLKCILNYLQLQN